MDAELCLLEPDPQWWLHPEAIVSKTRGESLPGSEMINGIYTYVIQYIYDT